MESTHSEYAPEVQMAAGGVVWKKTGDDLKLAVIHRPKYDDWSLPKGKPEGDEALGETARRELFEELGFHIRFLEFAGVVHYPLRDGRTKVVLFWHVTPADNKAFRPNREVDELLWLSRDDALRKLSHDVERKLITESPPPSVFPPPP